MKRQGRTVWKSTVNSRQAKGLCLPQRGTSADRQLAIYNEALASGATERQALVRVVDWLIEETVPVE